MFVGEDLTADRWLISPEVKPGSTVRFHLSAMEDAREENIEVLYSTTDDDPDSFTNLDDIILISSRWRDFEYTLPEDARYFAIRYLGNTEKSFGIVMDDISYEPAAGKSEIKGYDIFRNGSLVTENASAVGEYIDPIQGADNSTYYNIRPVIQYPDFLQRGMLSNTAFVGASSVADILLGNVTVCGSRGCILISGLDTETVDIYSVDGLKIDSVTTGDADSMTSVPVAAGIYIVKTADATYKVIVL